MSDSLPSSRPWPGIDSRVSEAALSGSTGKPGAIARCCSLRKVCDPYCRSFSWATKMSFVQLCCYYGYTSCTTRTAGFWPSWGHAMSRKSLACLLSSRSPSRTLKVRELGLRYRGLSLIELRPIASALHFLGVEYCVMGDFPTTFRLLWVPILAYDTLLLLLFLYRGCRSTLGCNRKHSYSHDSLLDMVYRHSLLNFLA